MFVLDTVFIKTNKFSKIANQVSDLIANFRERYYNVGYD